MKKTMTRQAAIAAGLKTYFTGNPCPKGHVADRRVSGYCVECSNQYNSSWRTADPERNKARVKSWKDANPEKVKEHNAKSHKREKDDRETREAAIARAKAWAAAHPEKVNARTMAWKKKNPSYVSANQALRRAAKLRRTPAWSDSLAIQMIYRAAEVIRTTGFNVHVDHKIPLQGRSVSGLHVHNNLQILSSTANLSKSNHF